MTRTKRARACGMDRVAERVRPLIDTIRTSRWCQAVARWWDKHADAVWFSATTLIWVVAVWCVVLSFAIAYLPVFGRFVVDYIQAIAAGEWTADDGARDALGCGLLLVIVVGPFVTLWWVARRVRRRRWAGTQYPTAVAAEPVVLPQAYQEFESRYPREFVRAVAAELGPDPRTADLQGALEERFEWWRWAVSVPGPREVAVHEAVHAVVVHALGGVVRRIDMFAAGHAGATTYPLAPRGVGQADASMFRVCVEVGPHLWLSRTPGWDGTGHGAQLPTPWAGRHADDTCGCSVDLDHVATAVTGMRVAGLTPTVWPGEAAPVDGTGQVDLLAWATARVTRILEANAAVVDELTAFLMEALDARRTVPGWELHPILRRVEPPHGVLLGVDAGTREPVLAGRAR